VNFRAWGQAVAIALSPFLLCLTANLVANAFPRLDTKTWTETFTTREGETGRIDFTWKSTHCFVHFPHNGCLLPTNTDRREYDGAVTFRDRSTSWNRDVRPLVIEARGDEVYLVTLEDRHGDDAHFAFFTRHDDHWEALDAKDFPRELAIQNVGYGEYHSDSQPWNTEFPTFETTQLWNFLERGVPPVFSMKPIEPEFLRAYVEKHLTPRGLTP